MISSVYALGVSPGRTTIDFKPSLERSVNFEIINSEGKDLEFGLSIDGELAEYVNLGNRKISVSAGEDKKTFSYDLKLPASLEPGLRTARIIITEIPKDLGSSESYVAATLAVATQLHVNVPFPGKYASSGFIVYNTEQGEDITFVFPVVAKGEFDLTSVHANIDIYNKANEKVASFNTKSISIKSSDKKELVHKWNGNLSIGEYRADATLIYDDGTLNLERIFSVGSKELELQEITVNDFNLGEIVKLEMLVENKWSEPIMDAYVETRILDEGEDVVASFKSSSYDVEALEKEVFVSYWDTAGVKEGTYASDVAIHYGEKVSRKNLEFEVMDNELVVIGLGYVISVDGGDGESSIVVVLVIVIVVLVLINLLWFLIIRKKIENFKGGKK